MSLTNGHELRRRIQSLYDACKSNEEDHHAASEQMQNRGQKFLIKLFAQRHMRFANRLAGLAQQIGFTVSRPGRLRNSLRRGWMDIQIAMIVPRVNRQAAAASKCEEGARALLQMYEETLKLPLPESVRTEIQNQRDDVYRIHRWLTRIANQGQWIIRLYDDAEEASLAVRQLVGSGIGENQITVTPINQIVLYPGDAEERGRSTMDAALVGGLIVATFGLGLGLIIGYSISNYAPDWPAGDVPLWISIAAWGLVGALAGGFIGGFFGFLIGRGLAEDDAELMRATADSGVNVVSVHTTEENHIDAAQILEIWHQRELEIAPAWQQR